MIANIHLFDLVLAVWVVGLLIAFIFHIFMQIQD